MPIHTVTLTGIDASTPLPGMQALAAEYPFVEFGVLYHATLQGSANKRYPCLANIADLAGRKVIKTEPMPRLALHICGSQAVGEFIESSASITGQLAKHFDRVQLNFKPGRVSLHDLGKVLDRQTYRQAPQPIIVRHDVSKISTAHWCQIRQSNLQVVFDASGGTGKVADTYPAPLNDVDISGYAGGFSPANISTELPKIEAATRGKPCWIDMESSLRDEHDRFDLARCEAVLKKVRAFKTPALVR